MKDDVKSATIIILCMLVVLFFMAYTRVKLENKEIIARYDLVQQEKKELLKLLKSKNE